MNQAAGGVVHLRRERELAAGHWLLSASPDLKVSRADWRDKGATWLQPGALFGAVIVPERLVHGALGLDGPDACARSLAEHLEGGPLFYSPGVFGQEGSYTALVSDVHRDVVAYPRLHGPPLPCGNPDSFPARHRA